MNAYLTSRSSGQALRLVVLLLAVVTLTALTGTGSAKASEDAEVTSTSPELDLTMHVHKRYLVGQLRYPVGDAAPIKGGIVCRGSEKIWWGYLKDWMRWNRDGLTKVVGIKPDGCDTPQVAVLEIGSWSIFSSERVEVPILTH